MNLAISFSGVSGRVLTILFAILFFGVIIALHEFGHFITAKLFKMRVNEYSIGMGPKLISRKRGETTYSWRALPIGGFVQLEGEDEESDDPRAFGNQKPWKRFIVLAAGGLTNVILGLLLICIMLGMQGKMSNRVITDVSDAMLSNENGVRIGDEILKVNGSRVFTDSDFYYDLYRDQDGVFDITVRRDGQKITLTGVPVYYSNAEAVSELIMNGEKKVTFFNLLPGAVNETLSMAKEVYLSIIDLIRGVNGVKDMSGIVGTVKIMSDVTTEAVEHKSYSVIFFLLAFITVNIGLFNLLPLPALDGGRLLFVVVEMIIRKPVPKKFEAVVHAVGFVLLIGLMIFITFNDIRNIFVK
ncbi:MAG: site-2 protease family protein [Clostridia bacterium]|nr:site-2 protease family protein [Clostridia bacterium]